MVVRALTWEVGEASLSPCGMSSRGEIEKAHTRLSQSPVARTCSNNGGDPSSNPYSTLCRGGDRIEVSHIPGECLTTGQKLFIQKFCQALFEASFNGRMNMWVSGFIN